MIEKYKEEIKGAILASGIWITILSFFPKIHDWYSNVNGTLGVALLLLFMWWIWK